MKSPRTSGYTLLELSLVLVIIGLLVSGVLWGLAVMRQAQLRSVMDDLDRYQNAMHSFYDKYNELPGDMADAEDFWGSDNSCPDTYWDGIPKKATCNGNGDGKIAQHDYDNGIFSSFNESFRAWQQLYNAGFIDAAMVGAAGTDGASAVNADARLGLNVPKTKFGDVGYMIYYLGCATCTFAPGLFFPAQYGHIIRVGKRTNFPFDYPSQPFLKPEEAQSIDAKIDDGMPASGKVLVPSTETSCVTSTTPADAQYNVTNHALDLCSLIYVTGL